MIDSARLAEVVQDYEAFVATSPPGGGLHRINAAVWTYLLGSQTAAGIGGDLLEIGVWHGYTGALMARMAAPGETLGLIDIFMKPETYSPTIVRFAGELGGRLQPWEASTFDLRRRGESLSPLGDLRFVHIDGEHSYEAIENDFLLIASKLADYGVVVFDDIFFDACPQLTAALFDLLRRHRSDIVMFALGLNKAYLCRPRALGFYRNLMRQAPLALEAAQVTVRTCAAAWSAEATYYGLTPRNAGEPRWLVMNSLTDDLSQVP